MAPDPALITPLGWELISDLPPILRDDPEHRAVQHCHAKETARQEEALEEVRAQFIPTTATTLGLPWWERLVRITVEEGSLTEEQRRTLIIGYIQNLQFVLSRYGWKVALDGILGPGWSYAEHDPDDPGSPAANTVRIFIPFPLSSTLYAETNRLIRKFTDAHIALELIAPDDLAMDFSLLDEGELG